MASQIRFARAEAARLNKPVYLCPVQIKTDGKPDQYCKSTYAGSGYAVWADSPVYDQKYERSKDESLRTIVMNKAKDQVKVVIKSGMLDLMEKIIGAEKKCKILAFFPDGSIKKIWC